MDAGAADEGFAATHGASVRGTALWKGPLITSGDVLGACAADALIQQPQ